MDGRIRSVLEDAVPDRTVDGLRATGPSWNETNRTVGVDFADGETIYLKVATDGDGSRIARERAVIAHVDPNYEVPVPTVVASDPDAELPYLATAPMDGRSLLDAWTESSTEGRASLARAVGTALARLHARRFDDHGHVTGGDAAGLELETGPWTDVLVATIEEMRTLSPSERFDHHFDDVIAAVEANRALLNDAPAALLHGDPALPNCLRDGQGVGFLDWELAHVGDPVRELHRVRDQQIDPLLGDGPDALVTALHDGYRAEAGGLPPGFHDRQPVYAAVRLLGTSGFFERTADFVHERPEDLARWLDAEMDRRLAAI